MERWSADKTAWERANGQPLPVLEGWKRFNAHEHGLDVRRAGVIRAHNGLVAKVRRAA